MLGSTRLLKCLSNYPRLPLGARLCLVLMYALGRDSGACFASAGLLARTLRVSGRMIERYLAALRREGFLSPEWRAGHTTSYSFLWHPVYAEITPGTPDTSVRGPLTLVSGGADTGVGGLSMYRTYDKDVRLQQTTPDRSSKYEEERTELIRLLERGGFSATETARIRRRLDFIERHL